MSDETNLQARSQVSYSFSNKLQILYGLNGATLSLPSLALVALVNDRVAIPIDLLSAYGAITFLPWSFKPMYGILERTICRDVDKRRNALLIILYLCSSISIILTAIAIPKNGVVLCFIAGFFRGIATSIPEFLIDLLLIDEARDAADCNKQSNNNNATIDINKQNLFQKVSGIFQAQAATSRNLGSLLANITMCFLLLFLQLQDDANKKESDDDSQLSDPVITAILLATSLLPLLGSIVVTIDYYHLSYGTTLSNNMTNLVNSGYEKITIFTASMDTNLSNLDINNLNGTNGFKEDIRTINKSFGSTTTTNKNHIESLTKWDFFGIFMFQCLIIWSALKRLIEGQSIQLWVIGFTILAISVLTCIIRLISIRCNSSLKSSSFVLFGPALFLVLKQAIPQASYQWYSYAYYLFQTSPFYLQIISLINVSMSTIGSNFYAKHIAPKSVSLIKIFIITIIMNTCVSFLYLIMSNRWNVQPENHLLMNFLILLPISSLSAFFSELQFLPSVVLATNCIQLPNDDEKHVNNKIELTSENTTIAQLFSMKDESNFQTGEDICTSDSAEDDPGGNEGVQYGLYTGCIDFGGQIGAWLTVPLVSALGINRNDWSKLSELIFICALCNAFSILFLILIVPTMRRQRQN